MERRGRRPIRNSPTAAAVSDRPKYDHAVFGGIAYSMPESAQERQLQTYLEPIRQMMRAHDYQILGRLSRVQVATDLGGKLIDFRKNGPVLAIHGDQLIVLDAWNGLPAKWDDTEELCSACLTECDVCNATGRKACENFKCGGSGHVPKPTVPCPAADCLAGGKDLERRPKKDCELCRGSGHYTELADCPVCKGSGKQQCSVCRGSSKKPTGIQGGSTNWRLPSCPVCQGSKFAHKEIPQNLEDFVRERIGNIAAIGPITRFAVESVGGEGTPPQVYDVIPDGNNQFMSLLIDQNAGQPGGKNWCYLIGGTLQPR